MISQQQIDNQGYLKVSSANGLAFWVNATVNPSNKKDWYTQHPASYTQASKKGWMKDICQMFGWEFRSRYRPSPEEKETAQLRKQELKADRLQRQEKVRLEVAQRKNRIATRKLGWRREDYPRVFKENID